MPATATLSDMPRHRRVVLPGCAHHVTQRGNNRRGVFFSDEERRVYLTLLAEYSAKYELDLTGFCLMTNHIHLIAIPQRNTSLAKALGRTHSDYARWLHIRRRESGHLWQNRFYSCPLQPTYAWAALAYVERNPVRAGLVARAGAWEWSSAGPHLGQHPWPDWLSRRPWSEHWTPEQWRTVMEYGLSEAGLRDRLQEASQTGKPLGDAEFINEGENVQACS